jgi:glycosyltransferase involved in cell wall biosynthesis
LISREKNIMSHEKQIPLTEDYHSEKAGISVSAQKEINHLNKSIRLMIQELDVKKAEIKSLTHDLNSIKSSTSWRITWPVRKFKLLLRKPLRMFRKRIHSITLVSDNSTAGIGNESFNCTGDDPQFNMVSSQKKMPTGWVDMTGKIVADKSLSPVLFIADEKGFSPENGKTLIVNDSGEINQLFYFPDKVQELRLDILDFEGTIQIQDLKFIEIGSVQALFRFLGSNKIQIVFHPGELIRLLRKTWHFYQLNGVQGILSHIMRIENSSDYQSWVQAYSTLTQGDRKRINQHISKLSDQPLISVIMPVYNTPEQMLAAAIESVKNQLYSNWELCIADDASTLPHVRTTLDNYSKNDQRIKIVFRKENGHISASSNSALALASGEFVALLDHDDELAPHALYMVVEMLNRFPDTDIIYSDEDKINTGGRRFSPHFKPDWNPELFYSVNYISHLGVIRRSLVQSVKGFRKGFEGSQDYDLVLRCVAETTPERIKHIPHILYHWRATKESTARNANAKDYATKAGIKALTDFFSRINPAIIVEECKLPTNYRVHVPMKTEPKVALIIPSRNNYDVLRKCVNSIIEKTNYKNYEIIIINNQSDEKKTLDYLDLLKQKKQCSVLDYDHLFNYSAINNYAVNATNSELVGLVNDDIEVISEEWLSEMVVHAINPEIGAVGAKLLYPDNRIQHAGVIVGLGGVAGHSHKYTDLFSDEYGYFNRLNLPQALSAVTGACLLVRRKIYEEVGGLNQVNLKVAFNDVDFCLRIGEAGYRNVWTPYAMLYHHESISRGQEDTSEKQARFGKEIEYMQKRWGSRLSNDPYYNPNLTNSREDFSLGWPSRAKKPWDRQSKLYEISET